MADRQALIPDYLRALKAELAACAHHTPLQTVYVGGGTPTLLSAGELAELLGIIRSCVQLEPSCEFTVEANPGTLDAAKAHALHAGGVNRVSIGAQSFDKNVLRDLGRIHGPREIRQAIGIVRDAGFDNIGLDLIFAVPGQSMEVFDSSMEAAIELGVQHLSTYGLSYDEGTVFERRLRDGKMQAAPEFLWLRMYSHARRRLREAGFTHYEISNFARPGRECAHNCNYWLNGSYLGVGAAATGFIDGERRANIADIEEYIRLALLCGKAPAFRERLDPEGFARETAAFGIRFLPGIEAQRFRERTGFELDALFGKTIERFKDLNLLEYAGGTLRLTERALPVADSVSGEFLSE